MEERRYGRPRKWHELTTEERAKVDRRARLHAWKVDVVEGCYGRAVTPPIVPPPVEDAGGRAATRRRAQAARAAARAHRL